MQREHKTEDYWSCFRVENDCSDHVLDYLKGGWSDQGPVERYWPFHGEVGQLSTYQVPGQNYNN